MKKPIVQHRQRLEIALDILKGCGHSCSGCMIDKELGGSAEDIPQLYALIQEMVADGGYVAFDLGVGPTDYMSSDNTSVLMDNPTFRTMAQMFDQVTFNAAFLEKDLDKYAKMCEEIDEACPNKAIRFLMPAAPDFFKTDKFGTMIASKLQYVKDTFKKAYLNEAGFVVNCTSDTVSENFDELMKNGFAVEFPTEKDDILNIPYGRLPYKDIMVGQNIRRMSHRISQFYSALCGVDERRRNPDLCYHTGTMVNLWYTGGKLYWVPFLKDDCPFLEEEFVIPKPWNMENVLSVRQKAMNEAIEYLEGTDCMTCVYMSSCTEKGIINIMKRLAIKDCMVGLQYVRDDSQSGVQHNLGDPSRV